MGVVGLFEGASSVWYRPLPRQKRDPPSFSPLRVFAMEVAWYPVISKMEEGLRSWLPRH